MEDEPQVIARRLRRRSKAAQTSQAFQQGSSPPEQPEELTIGGEPVEYHEDTSADKQRPVHDSSLIRIRHVFRGRSSTSHAPLELVEDKTQGNDANNVPSHTE